MQGRACATALALLLVATPASAQVRRDPGTGATSTGPWGTGPAATPAPGQPWHRPTDPFASPAPTATPRPQPTYRKTPSFTPRPQASFKHYYFKPTVQPSPKPHVVASAKPRQAAVSLKPLMPPGWVFSPPGHSVLARHGAVACVNGQASRVGVAIMAQGGNAVDAAIAVAFALAVVYPVAGNLGGGGFMLVRMHGHMDALDYRETAPARATRNMYLDASGNLTEKSRIGALAVAIPGTVAGMEAVHKRYGHLAWSRLVAPAIALATHGFTVNANLAGSYLTAQDTLLRFPATRRALMLKERSPKAGEKLLQPDLARTLTAIARSGARGFYAGPVAKAIVADQKANGGVITLSDLAHYQPRWRTPIAFTYHGHRVYSMPPPSSGGVGLAEILNVLEGLNLKTGLGWHTPAHIHWMSDAQRLAFADRNTYLGDPDFVHGQPVAKLVSKAYAARRRALIKPTRAIASNKLVPGLREREETTQFSVVDAQGNAVSSTYTLNGLFGSGMVARGTGVVLNDEMDDFAAKPGKANMFGLVQGEKNAIGPGKRPLSSMTPTIVLDPRGRLELVIGSPGGPTIITTVAQVISNVVDFGLPLNFAIAAPRFHAQDQPDFIFHEKGGLPLATRVALVHMGHEVRERVFIGDAEGVRVRPDGLREAFSDPRHGGEAAGY